MKYLTLVLVMLTTLGTAPRVYASSILAATPPLGAIAITEVLPNAVNESTGEFVEVYNAGTGPVDLGSWKLTDASGLAQAVIPFAGSAPTGIKRTLLNPGQVGLILDKDYAGEYNATLIALDSSDQLALMTTSGGNVSLANTSDGVSIVAPDGTTSDSVNWSSDPGSEVSLGRMLDLVGQLSDLAPGELTLGYVAHIEAPPVKPELEITELLPSPSSGEEFIELHNTGATEADLANIELSDASGQTKLLSSTLAAGAYAIFYKSDTGIALNNSGDSVTLSWTVDGSVLDSVLYEDAPTDQSWALISGHFDWTLEVTPGAVNVLRTPPEPTEPQDDTEDEPDPETDNQDVEPQPEALSVKSLAELSELEDETLVSVRGVVAAPIGTFYKDTLDLVDGSAGILVKVTDDSSLPKTEELTVTGELDRYSGILRITASSIEAVDSAQGATLAPIDLAPGEVAKEHVGRLVRLQGTVSSRSGKSFRVSAGDSKGSQLVSVRKGSGISAPAPKKGAEVRVTGIVLSSSGKLVVAPRATSDVVDTKGKTVYGAPKTLLKTGSPLADLSRLAASATPALWALSNGLRVVRGGSRRAGRSGRSKSSRDHGGR